MSLVTIHTTQNVDIDYELAKTGARIGGFLLDLTVFLFGYGLLSFVLIQLNAVPQWEVLFYLAPLFLFITYYFLSESLFRGRTVGKKIVGTRVIRLDGRDPTPADFLARAIFLMPDVVFSAGVPAIILTATSEFKQRIGDLVAGTAVIAVAKDSEVTLAEVLAIRRKEDHEPEFPEVQRFTDGDMIVVKNAVLRLRRYNNVAHREAVRELAIRMADLLEIDKKTVTYTPEKFLEILLLDYIVLTR